MKYKKIEIGKWYYVRRFECSQPRSVWIMQVLQKGSSREIVMRDNIDPFDLDIIEPKNVLAETTKPEGETNASFDKPKEEK